MKNLFFLMMLILFCISCAEEDISGRPISQSDIWNCYNDSEWSDVKVKDELIGKWKWIYTENFWTPNEGWNTENENTVIEFLNDSSLQISVNSVLMGTTKWSVKPQDGELYGLELDSTITALLHGRILICGEILEFNNSYIDGSDNFFKKYN